MSDRDYETIIECDHNLSHDELVMALGELARAESVDEALHKSLGDDQKEVVLERYMRDLNKHMLYDGKQIDSVCIANIQRFVDGALGLGVEKSRRLPSSLLSYFGKQSKARGLRLSQENIEELIRLISAHYRIQIRLAPSWGWDIDRAMEQRWKALGVVQPNVQLAGYISDAFIAGRLSQILDDGVSLSEMRRMAREFPVPRESSLALQAVQERVGFDLSGGVGYRMQQLAGQTVVGFNTQRLHDIIGSYRRKELRATPTNRSGLTPEEVAQTETDRAVSGWRGLARELRNRMASEDRNRDWERVATSSLRLSHSIGAITAMAEQGIEFLYYHVQTGACRHCKRLYLDEKGNPIKFKVSEIMQNILETGGANYGRSARYIGNKKLGWIPNALAHPWCQCRPRRWIDKND